MNGAYKDSYSFRDLLRMGVILAAVVGVFVFLVIMILRWRDAASFGPNYHPDPGTGEERR